MTRKFAVFAGAFFVAAALPACAAIMDPTERSPRPDPAVESGEVENPVEMGSSSESPENPPEALETELSEVGPPGVAPGGGESKGRGKGGPSGVFVGPAPIEAGAREVGEAGEVEFRVERGVLNLVGVRANEGWDYQLGKQDFREAKVFFTREGSQWEFEAESKPGGVLEIETKNEVSPADPGSYEVGEAGEVSFSTDDGGIVLDDYAAAEGWSANVEENDSEEVHLKFIRDGDEYKFEAEYDDGIVEVNIDRKERGSIAG